MFLLLISIATTQLVALASPGPDFFFISQVAASSTRKQSFRAVCGVTLGVFIWALLAILGLNILLNRQFAKHTPPSNAIINPTTKPI